MITQELRQALNRTTNLYVAAVEVHMNGVLDVQAAIKNPALVAAVVVFDWFSTTNRINRVVVMENAKDVVTAFEKTAGNTIEELIKQFQEYFELPHYDPFPLTYRGGIRFTPKGTKLVVDQCGAELYTFKITPNGLGQCAAVLDRGGLDNLLHMMRNCGVMYASRAKLLAPLANIDLMQLARDLASKDPEVTNKTTEKLIKISELL